MELIDKNYCIGLGKGDVSKATLPEFNISYILLWDSHAYRMTMA